MSRMEDLLRDALAMTPTPVVSPHPVADLEGRVRRARRRRNAAAVALVAVVVAAVAVVPTLFDSERTSLPIAPPTNSAVPTPTPGPATWSVDGYVTGLARADGSVWSLTESLDNPSTEVVERRDPGTGRVLDRTELEPPLSRLEYGAGLLWAYGGGDGAYPESQIITIDPNTGEERGQIDLDAGPGPTDVAFAHGSAWFVWGDTILRLTPSGRQLDPSGFSFPATRDNPSIERTGDGALWLGPVDGEILEVLPAGIGRRFSWPGRPLTTAGANSIWATESLDRQARLVELTPSLLAQRESLASGNRLMPGFRADLVVPDSGGLWLAGSDGVSGTVAYYDARTLRSQVGVPEPARRDLGVDEDAGALVSLGDGRAAYTLLSFEDIQVWQPTG